MQKTILSLAFQLVLCAGVFSQPIYYSVKFPDDKTIIGCGAYPDTSDYPEITYYSNCNFNVGISVKDQVFNTNSTGGCKKILRTWKLIWWCDYNPNGSGPTIIPNPMSTDVGTTTNGDVYNHGYLQYEQVIKVIDNVPPAFVNCPSGPVLFCDYTNNDPSQYGSRCEGPVNLTVKLLDDCSKTDITVTYRLYLDLDGNGSMETYQTSSQPGAWPIEKVIIGDTVMATIKLPTGVGLPYGKHKVEWIANDGCGNQSLCKYEFEVKDCKPPTITCHNGLSVNIMPTGMITLWATDFVLYFSDNCTPNDQIKIAIRKAGTGTGFPFNETSVTFDCNEVGQQFVEVWAIDNNGNADFCQTYVIVQDNWGICVPPGPVSGNLTTVGQHPVPGVNVVLKSNPAGINQQFSAISDASGKYTFPHAPGTCNYSIIPKLDTLAVKGVNTLDVLLTNWHINGTDLFDNPYQYVAADVNRDATIGAADIDAMSNLILGTTTAFPNNSAWHFIPAAYAFPGQGNPIGAAYPEKISTVCPATAGQNQHFIAVKSGDVDDSVDPSSLSADPDDRSGGAETAMFKMPNQRFVAGDEVTATLISPELSSVLGFQFTLFANQNILKLVSAEATLNEKIAVYPDRNSTVLSWYTKSGEAAGEKQVLRLKFVALQNGSLKQAIQLNGAITKAEAYGPARNAMNVALSFISTPPAEQLHSKLDPVSPNPLTGGVVNARFFLPEAGNATLSLSNATGKIVAVQTDYFEAGWHLAPVQTGEQLPGLYFLQLQTPFGSEARRVMIQR